MKQLVLGILLFCCQLLFAQQGQDASYVPEHYTKKEVYIPMRDGTKLFTAIYEPKDKTKPYPIMMIRTPYSVAPYGADKFRPVIGPSLEFAKDGYIFVYQDVRGKYKSEGLFVANRPYIKHKKKGDIDETTDTYDSIDWLMKHIRSNKKVGIWGVSSPGFYASMALIDAHPNLTAVSPQAPVTDWFMGDDRHHNGAFMLMGSFSFLSSFGKMRDSVGTTHPGGFYAYNTTDGYDFYLKSGPLKNFNEKYLHGKSVLWKEMMDNPDYNSYWQERSYTGYLEKVKPHVLVVGGWFDQEDLYGPLKTYEALAKSGKNKLNFIMGPWYHGSWTRGDGRNLGNLNFEAPVNEFYRSQMELAFFKKHLKGEEAKALAPVSVFVTGANEWNYLPQWPSKDMQPQALYLQANQGLSFEKPQATQEQYASYTADPNKPVPYTAEKTLMRGFQYMYEDQVFASRRPDVLVFESEVLTEDVKIMGNIQANLFISTTGTDADYIVKLIDVHPYEKDAPLSDCQCLVRGEVMRAKYRNSFSKPEPLTPNQVTNITFDMQDAAHVFKKGHKIMVQVQSSWFPLVDRNPQKFVNIYQANEEDFEVHQHRIYLDKQHPSHILLPIVKNNEY
ncbi:CocE/NonD family hydrolase [Sphingobacterium humi]|uniref:CocE/NonD family hydrolase n=1 Tax=Sphingobacterium humi TaxID=1796905 RepID=A0A6N8KYU2_9SPHI|nr:CocE/NonD family hydrolase [Sphingobacterium humi]MVZ62286.1 CocE/NonD family hydrolase [Sphingobacterium humi]